MNQMTTTQLKIEVGREYRTRDGRKARVICTDRYRVEYPIVALVSNPAQGEYAESVCSYRLDGTWHPNGVVDELDLVAEWREPVRVSGWVNVYPPHMNVQMSLRRSRAEANLHAGVDRIACIYVSGVEGVDGGEDSK